MAASTVVIVVAVCLLYVGFGFWAVARIFPDRGSQRRAQPTGQPARSSTPA